MKIKKYLKRFFDPSLFTVKSSLGTLTLFSLLMPLLFEAVMNQLQGTVSTIILSGYSDNAVAAVGAVNPVISMSLIIFSVVALGATVVVSNALGAEDVVRAREVSLAAILTNVGVCIPITLVTILLAPELMAMLNLTGEVYLEAVTYFRIRMAFTLVNALTSAFLALLKCYGFPRYTFWIGLLSNVLNLLLNIWVVYFPDYSPIHGVAGVAVSAGVSNFIALLVTLFLFHRLRIGVSVPESAKELLRHIGAVMKIGLPSALTGASVTVASIVTTSFVASIGDYALSARVYFNTVLSYVYLFSMSAGSANSLLVGRCYGARDFDRMEEMNRHLCRLTRAVNLSISLLALVLCRPLVGIFTESEEILSLAVLIFAVDLIAEQARAISQVYEYALRGAGDVWFSLVSLIASCWICSIGIPYLLTVKLGFGLVGIWIGTAADETVRALVTYFRWRSGKWKHANETLPV